MDKRRKALLDGAMKRDCPLVASATSQNVFYATGFWGEGIVLIGEDRTILFTSPLEEERAKQHAKECEVMIVKMGRSTVREVVREIGPGKRVCFDEVRSSLKKELKRTMRGNVVFDPSIFFSARRVKDEDEVAAMTEGAEVVDGLYEFATTLLRPKISEREVAGELLAKAVRSGCDLPSYPETLSPFIVASGPNSALPHSELTNRRLKVGDVVVLDLTVRCRGYVVDTTRTFTIGKASGDVKKVHRIVQQAQQRGIDAIEPGVPTGDVDRRVRDVIKTAGYGRLFVHGTGHGVGLDVHEPPWLRKGRRDVLMKGDVVTVEPGIYYPGKFGVRIEDTVLISEGAEPFTKFTRELMVVG